MNGSVLAAGLGDLAAAPGDEDRSVPHGWEVADSTEGGLAAAPGDEDRPAVHGFGCEDSGCGCMISDIFGGLDWLRLLFRAGNFVPDEPESFVPWGAGDTRVNSGGGTAEGE